MENPNDKAFFQELYRVTEENNVLLKKIRRGQRISQIAQFLPIIIFVLVGVGSMYFIKPYLNQLLGMYGGVQETVGVFEDLLGTYSDLQNFNN